MWQKDDYQEQMLGYLGEVETEIKRFAYSRQLDLNELYSDLDNTIERLWRLIGANDADWEGFRYPLETSCDRLQRAFYRLPSAGALILPASGRITENHESKAELWETVEMLG